MRLRQRGLTLVELMVTVAIISIVITLTLHTLLAFRELVHVSTLKRRTASTVRQALRFLERDLALAGYGLEPALAFDFTVYGGGGAPCTGGPGQAPGTSSCPQQRDRTDGPDELVFYARSPAYWGGDLGGAPEGRAWRVAAVDTGSVTLTAHGGERLGRGQTLQLVCSGGTASTYVRVRSSTTLTSAGDVEVALEPAVEGDPFAQDPAWLGPVCAGTMRAFAVERFRYYVDPAVVLADGSTAPFLMLDKGVDRDGDGTVGPEDLIPIAPGIVDLQVGYVRPEPQLVEVGSTAGTAISFCNLSTRPLSPGTCPGGLRVVDFTAGTGAGDPSLFTYLVPGGGTGLRTSPDVGNITAVHVALVGRSSSRTSAVQQQPLLLNRSEPPGGVDPHHVYATSESVVFTPNMQTLGLSFL